MCSPLEVWTPCWCDDTEKARSRRYRAAHFVSAAALRAKALPDTCTVLSCACCGAKRRVLAVVTHRDTARELLLALGLSAEAPPTGLPF